MKYIGIIFLILAILFPLSSCTSSCSPSSSSSSSHYSSSHSSSSYSSGAPTGTYFDDKGGAAYSYSDGSTEYTDGYGHVVRDSNGDGTNDYYSSDGGNSWSRI